MDAVAAAEPDGSFWLRAYNALWYPVLPFALLAAGGARNRMERLGRTAINHSEMAARVWFHAASVGEIEGIRPLVRRLTAAFPQLSCVVTVMTPAGREAARTRLAVEAQLAPFDHPAVVRAFVASLRPSLAVITETELWPNFFVQARQAGIRLAIVNGRLSARSFSSYRRIRPLIARILRSTDLILVQSQEDHDRFLKLGAPLERLAVTGNSKYELEDPAPPLPAPLLEFARDCPILIAGSTGPGEERIMLAAYRRLRERFPPLALILAPRHLSRLPQVERELRDAALPYIRSSALHRNNGNRENDQVLLLDSIGELRALYPRAAVAFVGGSMIKGRGGQSMSEPASAGVPMLFGPHYENHRQLGDTLIEAGAARVVKDDADLEQFSAQWLNNTLARRSAGRNAHAVMVQLAGGTAETVRYLCRLLTGI